MALSVSTVFVKDKRSLGVTQHGILAELGLSSAHQQGQTLTFDSYVKCQGLTPRVNSGYSTCVVNEPTISYQLSAKPSMKKFHG